jgi:hypothetical protein
MKPWTPEQERLLASNLSDEKISEKTGRSEAAIRGKRQRMAAPIAATVTGTVATAAAAAPTTFEEDKAKVGGDHWKREYDALHTKYEKALAQSSVTDRLVELASELAPVSYDPRPAVTQRHSGVGSAQSAVLVLSDTHVGQVISPDQTLGFGGYNFTTFLNRLQFLESGVASILEDHTTTKIDELVLCLGGDMMDGALIHGAEAKQKNTLFNQFYGAGHAIAQFIRNISPLVPRVRIFCAVGNHPRWQNQHKMPTDNRYSNLDQFLYAYIQALTSELGNVFWTLDQQPFALFQVQNFNFHLSHGDHLRGGDKALGIPNHAVGRMVSSTAQLYGKHDMASPNYYLLGHMHRGIVLPHARGSVLVNGGFPGLDGYGLMNGFSPVDPSQLLFFVHPKFGKTATYDIQLKFATQNNYILPTSFKCV